VKLTTMYHIQALTFDFWWTLFRYPAEEQADEIRVQRLVKGLAGHGFCVSLEKVRMALAACRKRTMEKQYNQGLDLTPPEQIGWILNYLGLPVREAVIENLLVPYTTVLFEVPPVLMEDARELLHGLAKDYRLGLICNTGTSPGSTLRHFLRKEGILTCFSYLLFSNEVGIAKPNPKVFEMVLRALEIKDPGQAVHIGDDPRSDINGAKQVGMKAIWFNSRGLDSEITVRADATIKGLKEIKALAFIHRNKGPEG